MRTSYLEKGIMSDQFARFAMNGEVLTPELDSVIIALLKDKQRRFDIFRVAMASRNIERISFLFKKLSAVDGLLLRDLENTSKVELLEIAKYISVQIGRMEKQIQDVAPKEVTYEEAVKESAEEEKLQKFANLPKESKQKIQSLMGLLLSKLEDDIQGGENDVEGVIEED
jgi:hypothetical protein